MFHPLDPEHRAGFDRTRPSDPPTSSPSQQLFDARPGISEDLLELVLSTPTVETYLDELVQLVERVSPVIAGCGVTLRCDHGELSVAVSNPLAGIVDEVQYELDQGPCLQSLRTGEVVVIDDVATDHRFGVYSAHASAHGVLSSLSVPLRVAGTSVGALNCYFLQPDGFGDAVRAELVALAAQAQVFLELTLRTAQQSSVVDQLHTAMQTRSTIDQALGIMMTRQRCTASEAFAVLRSVSQSRNRKIFDDAVDLITTATGSPPQAGRFEI